MEDKSYEFPESKPRLFSVLRILCVNGHKTVKRKVLDTSSFLCPKCGCGWKMVDGEY